MRLPSLFKTPKHQRFEIQPRYYDPIKEDIEKRTNKIKRQLEADKKGKAGFDIRQAYADRKKSNRSADLFQLLMILIVGVTVGGWIMYGNSIYFVLFLLIPLYIFLRRKGR